MSDVVNTGRLALREEGEFWNAYYAMPNTMHNALLLGSVRMTLVVGNEKRKRAFMQMMMDIVDGMLQETIGSKAVSWSESAAPESERTRE